mgnify:FL=1
MNKKLLRNTAWYFVGTVISAILGFISSPILTRVLTTEVYAQYGMVASFTTLVATFVYLGQDEAFMRYFDRRKEPFGSFFWRCIRLPLVLCIIILFLLLEPNHIVLSWVFACDIQNKIAILIAAYIAMLVLQRFLMLTARMEERAANYSVSNIATKVMFFVALYVFYFMGQVVELTELVLALMVGVLCALAINLVVVVKVKHGANPEGEDITSKELLYFGVPFAISSTMLWVVPLLEKIVIRDLTNWTVLAIYTSAAIFVTAMGLIKTTVNSIWVPYAYKHYTNEAEFKKTFRQVGVSLCWLCLMILAGLIVVRRWVVFIFDSAYYDSMLIAPALVCGACFDLLTCIYSIGINIKKKTQFHVIVPFVQLAISMATLYIGLPRWGLIATGISYLLSIAISRIVQMAIALHYYGIECGYGKLAIMLGIYIAVGILSCFVTSIQFDILCGLFLIVFGTVIAGKDLYAAFTYVLPNKVRE